jgi:hypothetical protein
MRDRSAIKVVPCTGVDFDGQVAVARLLEGFLVNANARPPIHLNVAIAKDRECRAGFSMTSHEHVQNIEYFPRLFDFVARCLSFLFFINRPIIDYPPDARPRAKREQLSCWTSSIAGER